MTTPLLSDLWEDSTTGTYVNTTERPVQSFPLYIAQRYLRIIYTPFVLLFGTFGNVMIIIIMRRTASSESTFHKYFIATAVFDVVFLVTTMVKWIRFAFGFDISTTHTVVCKMQSWLTTGSGTISCWCLVCMTVHRATSVMWPHRVNLLCTHQRVLLLLIGIVVFFALLYSHYMVGFEIVFFASVKNSLCTVRYDNHNYLYFYQYIFVYIELLVYCLLPFTVLILSNGVLIWKLGVSVKTISKTFGQRDSEQVQSREKAANSVTLTVIVVSLAFLVLTLPASISFILDYFAVTRNQVTGYERAKRFFTSMICTLLGETNSAVNFYLYILTGKRFREECIKIMCCGRNSRRHGAS